MPAKTLKQIQDEADRLFGKKASSEKFKWRQQQQAAAGLDVEKKTRGGVAGAYDRNKKLVSAGATGLGFLLGGPGGAALARGAVQGLDRPGQGGIGFDVTRGLKGAAEGYGAGSALQMASAGAAKLGAKFGIGGAPPVYDPSAQIAEAARQAGPVGQIPLGDAQSASSVMASRGASSVARPDMAGIAERARSGVTGMPNLNLPTPTMPRGGMGPITSVPASASMPLPPIGRVAGAAGQAAGAAGRAAGAGTLRSLLTNPQVIAGAAGGVADVMGQRSQQRIAEQQMEQQASQFQQQFDVAEEERKRQQAQANRLAGLFMPTR